MEVIKLFLRVVDGVVGADEVGRISGAIVDGLANVDDSVLFIASNITEIFALITNNARRIDSFHPPCRFFHSTKRVSTALELRLKRHSRSAFRCS